MNERVGVPVLSLGLGLRLIYIKTHKNLMECSGTFHCSMPIYCILLDFILLFKELSRSFRKLPSCSTWFFCLLQCSFEVCSGAFHLFLQHSAMFCNVPQCSMMFCDIPLGSMGLRNIPSASMGFRNILGHSRMFYWVPGVSTMCLWFSLLRLDWDKIR